VEVELTKSDMARVCRVAVGDLVLLQLDESPTTGYRWAVMIDNPTIVKLGGDEYRLRNDAPGAAGQRSFHLMALAPGLTTVHLSRRRLWEEQTPLEQLELRVEVVAT
jgi:inhibitor of cysteine peptidase